ncbi:MAG TPA: SpoIIE family protein phosphatase [Acidothermaceae bacterium]|nr:SpoIIE family protein phosphatase [Acidothermaceae bacterium]
MTTDLQADVAREDFYAALLDDDAEKLYEQAPCGYLSTTPDGLIIKVNQTFLTLTGYRRDDLVGRRAFADLLTAGGRIYHETHYAPMLRLQGKAREIALDLVRADGSKLPVLVNSVLERLDDGAPAVVRTAVFDATERRAYERELLQAKRRAEESEAHATDLARTLQQTLIPPAPPEIPGLDIAAAYRPAGAGDEVGGDFYDIFELSDGSWVVGLGDVRGKGVQAAVVAALARHTIRAAAVRARQPSEVLRVLNTVLLRDDVDRYCTVVVLFLRRIDNMWKAIVSCGGHAPPLLVRSGRELSAFGKPGTLIGVFDEPELVDIGVTLKAGESLVLTTDGVTEGRRGREFFGESRLAAAVAANCGSAQSIVDGILADVLAFQGGHARDDIAIVVAGVAGVTGV